MKVAVVIPVYNRKQSVLEALDSVYKQSRPPDQVVVVDDGSTDGTSEAVLRWQQLAGKTPAVHLIRLDTNSGASLARNIGINQADDCGWIAPLDSDDVWPRCFLERAIKSVENEPRAIAATADRLFVHADSQTRKVSSSRMLPEDPVRWLYRHDGGIGSCSILRRDAILTAGAYDESIPTGHDSLLYLHLSQIGQWKYIPGPPVTFNRGLAATRDEATHIHHTRKDSTLVWAQVYERFLQEANLDHDQELCAYVSQRWYRAGRNLTRNQDRKSANSCYKRSLYWKKNPKPLVHMAWNRLLLLVDRNSM